MTDSEGFENRSREIADTTRRLLIALNTGGIAVTFGVAGSLAAQDVAPSWAVAPVSVFVAGLVVSAISLLMAKHKAIKRRDAVREGQAEPNFKVWHHRNFTYEVITLVIFVVAVYVGLNQLQYVVPNQPRATQEQVEVEKTNSHNNPIQSTPKSGATDG